MRWAIVISGIVDNVVVWNGTPEWTLPAGAEAVQLQDGTVCNIGWEWDGTTFSQPVEP
jgi:hypothetical protein